MIIDTFRSSISFETRDSVYKFSKFDPSWEDIIYAIYAGLVSLGYSSDTAWEILLSAEEFAPSHLTNRDQDS